LDYLRRWWFSDDGEHLYLPSSHVHLSITLTHAAASYSATPGCTHPHPHLALTILTLYSPYFDDVNAIIFLAPISCFDEHLTEDPSINRLKDSFILWEAICSSKQLANATLVVFLNKCDLLGKKIRSGVSVKKHLPSFGERANETGTVIKCTFPGRRYGG